MLLGISSFTYGWAFGANGNKPSMTISQLLQLTSAFGLKCLQIGDNAPLHCLDTEQLASLRAIAKGIRLEVGARGLTPDHLEQYIQIATSIDAPLLRFVVDGPGYEPAELEIISIIRNVLPELRKRNIILGIENHDRFKAEQLRNILDTLADDQVGICLDTVNSLGAGEGLDWVTNVLAPLTVNLHIKEFSISRFSHNMGFEVVGAPAGKGMMDITSVIDQLGEYKRCKSAVLEQWVPWQGTYSDTVALEKRWSEESINYLKGLSIFNDK